MGKKSKKTGICVYCGQTKPLTKDHVIAKCLFPGALPTFMVTVPACYECNGEKAKLDDYLRDTLVVDLDSEKSKVAHEILTGKVFRAADKNHSLVIRGAKSEGKFEPIYSPGGIYLGQGFSFPLDGDKINRIFSLIVRGLYFNRTKHYLPQDCKFDVRRLTGLEFKETWEELKKIGCNGPYKLGEGVFTFVFIYAAEEPTLSHWWLWFYESICIYIKTEPAGFDITKLTLTTT